MPCARARERGPKVGNRIDDNVMIQGTRQFWRLVLTGGAAVLGAVHPLAGAVNLQWQPATQTAVPNQIVECGLLAVWTGSGNQNISAMDVLLSWDPTKLELLGVVNNGPYQWLQSGFPNDSGLDGLNNTWIDGDAKYNALAQFVVPAQATTSGLLVTTFRFRALSATNGTQINIPAALGNYSHTAVYGNAFPNENITGTLGSAEVVICGLSPSGDLNASGSTAGDDIGAFVQAVLMNSAEAADVCSGDFNGNGVLEVGDVPGMVAALLGA